VARYLIPLGVFVVLAAFLAVGLKLDPKQVPSPLIGKPVPTFSLPRLKDPALMFDQAELNGKVSLVNIWATWCVSCRAEHEVLMALARTDRVPIYGLNYKDDRKSALRWLEQLGDPYVANAFDADGRVGIDWGVYGAPETFVIDSDGLIQYKHIGPLTLEIVEERILPMVDKLGRGAT
jgi:cytochrome c biogenesis protein CcmG/thiol:disulfide interchange protein DsbE